MMQMMQMMQNNGGCGGGGGGKGGGKGKPDNMKAGDWICPGCGDHQFARNSICKMCSTPKPELDLDNVCKGIPPVDHSEIDMFQQMNGIEQHAIEKIKALDPRLARFVISKDLSDARDKTAVTMGRCQINMKIQKGDWICPSCYDHVYAKKAACQLCSTPRPM